MRIVNIHEEKEQERFARSAGIYFAENPKCTSYTYKDIVPGCFIALRWGAGNDCVLILKLDEWHEPAVYQQFITEVEYETSISNQAE